MRLLLAASLFAALASAQFQTGRIATDYFGHVSLFESGIPLRGGTSGVDHILSWDGSLMRSEEDASSTPSIDGVAWPHTNDIGTLRAVTQYRVGLCFAIGGCAPPTYTGIVRNVQDGWEFRRPGRAVISHEGRWAAFSSLRLWRTTWVDLWTGQETAADLALNPTAMADDGTLVTPIGSTLAIHTPGLEPRTFSLPFFALSALIDRTATVAAVTSLTGIYKIDLASGAISDWAPTWDNAQLLDIAPAGRRLLFSQWGVLYLLEDPAAGPTRLSEDGEFASGAALTGDQSAAIALNLSGIVRYPLDGSARELLVPGATSFPQPPVVLAPGLWLRMAGSGTAQAAITLNGQPVEPLAHDSAQLSWAVPSEMPTGSATLEIEQPGSPFEPFRKILPVQLAAPRFLIQRDLGEGTPYYADSPYIRHAETGQPVNWMNPARPGESIEVLMTGLNHQGPAIEWLVNRVNVDEYVRPVFESERPHEDNPHWRWVRLRLPDVLPGPICWLSAGYGETADSAYLTTSTGLVN